MSRQQNVETPAIHRILAALDAKPGMSASDIAEEAFVGVTTLACGGYLAVLRKKQLIHVSGWRQIKGRFTTPLYTRGPGVDVPRPQVDDTNRSAPGMDTIVSALERYGALTYREIAQFSGLSPNTVMNSGFLDALIAQRRIHIVDWRRGALGPMRPVYASGDGPAAPKPVVLSHAQRSERYRERERIKTHGLGMAVQIADIKRAVAQAGA